MSPRGWWGRRTVRARLVLSAAVPLSVALVVGTVAVTAVFAAGRLRDLDAQTKAESDQVVQLVTSGQLPTTLPVPAGSPLLVQVLGPDGSVLAAGPSASRVVPLAAASSGDVRTDEEGSYAGVPLRVRTAAAAVAGERRTVVVAAPLGDVRRALAALRVVLLLVVPLLVLATVFTVWWVAGLALRPVEQLRRAADRLAHEPAANDPLPVPAGRDELAQLATTLNELLTSLRRLVVQQEQFVADAAHELRAPLTSLRVQLDVARAHPSLVQLPVLLDDLDRETQRMTALVEDLLALARWKGGTMRHVPVDLGALADGDGPPVVVIGDEDALRRLVDNLTSNALRSARQVRVTVGVLDGTAVLDVDDDGPGIPVADRERVFDRWVRLDDARTRKDGGAGLGLALVREIARLHRGDVSAQDSPLGGVRLRVRLPLAKAGDTAGEPPR